ncbi:hypothetical protein [Rhizobium mesosinicum]|uniref:DUF4145 domain-containing protein n=1 Tax=Rhizobium mesosinicum TaxID=335017 RepID=A0ABS7GM66_9HYPH|nr:hypothetical protein [Rhizobium mesosinicum]MBW9051075.1 hypothetical protein [Rhizobium mesosinicum]
MSFHKSRVDTIRALLAGSPAISKHASFGPICSELEEVKSLIAIAKLNRRHLLAVLHSSRALDDALKAFLIGRGLGTSKSLGGSLTALASAPPGKLSAPFTMRTAFQNSIVNVRNRYMHESGAFPANDYEIRTLLGEIESCVGVVLSLE